MDKHSHPTVKIDRGFTLLETALTLVILGLMLGPLIRLMASQHASDVEMKKQQEQRGLQEALEAFVLTHGRLPCPSDEADGTERRQGDQCTNASGWFPSRSLGLPKQFKLHMALADLASAGAPADGALLRTHPFDRLSPQQLSEIVFNPPTVNLAVGQGPLPALHLCQQTATSLPSVQSWGCGNAPTLSESTVLVLLTEAEWTRSDNSLRQHQFILNPLPGEPGPVWLSYDRLFWLWLQGGWLSGGSPAQSSLN